MDAARDAQRDRILEEVLSLDPGGRAALLDRACANDPELRLEIERLLRLNDQMSTEFLPHPATSAAAIGPYHLLQTVGQGGMGEVWLAEQKSPVRRRVALKLIKPGMDTHEVLGRFESEFRALALMDHPGIAKVFEAGSTPQGRPYFAMEYVPGLAITEYCDKHQLTIQERLQVFRSVCEAVRHAHQKAIIHRDLKPSNILVSAVDGKATPKIIDFGVAKAIGQPLTAETMFTRLGAVIGTPEYMSPEQALSKSEDIDTRADVYSLGVVLYELLVGVLPIDYHNLAFDEVLRTLRDKPAPPPSTRLVSGGQCGTVAKARRSEPRTLRRQLRGDLDSITLKALEKDRSRRYGSSWELAADIGRYLDDEPIIARPTTFFYRAKKAIARNRIASVSAAGLTALLVTFSIAQALQIRRITEERDRLDRTAAFMVSMFRVPHHGMGPGLSITAEEILNTANKEVESNYARDPVTKGRLEEALGEIYDNLGGSDNRAHMLTRDAVRTLTKADGADGRETLRAKRVLGAMLWSNDKPEDRAESVNILRDTLKAERRVMGSRDPETLKCMASLGTVLYYEGVSRGHKGFSESEALLGEALAGQRRVLGADNSTTLETELRLIRVLASDHKYPEADALARELVDAARRNLPGDNNVLRVALFALASVLREEKNYSEADQLAREWVDLEDRLPSDDTFSPFSARRFLFHVLKENRKYSEAEAVGQRLLEQERGAFGPNHPMVGRTLYNLACVAAVIHRRDKALLLLGEAFAHGLERDDVARVQNDPEMDSIRNDPQFAATLAQAK